MRHLKILSAVLFLAVPVSLVQGQSRDFPYQAKVVDEELFVRSGAGDSWHATQRLRKDTVVTVHRHDPGGWYMIEPPDGSFSWIPQKFVRTLGASDGEVTENNVVAFVGSEFGDDTTVWQRRLTVGEKVRILGQQEVVTLSGPVAMYRIAPPRREFRWIPGSGVIPVDEQRRRQLDHDPFATPSNAVRPANPALASGRAGSGGVTDVPPVNPESQVARLQQILAEQKRLADIDLRFREMIQRDPSGWNLDGIENDYRELQRQSKYRPLAGQIDLRYPAIERYRRRHAEFMDFRQLTSQTEMKDAELVARTNSRFGHPGAAPALASVGTLASPGPESVVIPGQAPSIAEAFAEFSGSTPPSSLSIPGESVEPPALALNPAGDPTTAADGRVWEFVGGASAGAVSPVTESAPGTVTEGLTNALTVAAAGGSNPAASGTPNRYVGAGIVQRTAGTDGTDQFVLTSPTGKVLAHLKARENVSFQPYVGQQVGLHGSRSYRDELQSDLIEVSGLETVRIRQ